MQLERSTIPVNKYIFKTYEISSPIGCLNCKGLSLIYRDVSRSWPNSFMETHESVIWPTFSSNILFLIKVVDRFINI